MSHAIEKLTERRSLAVKLAERYGMDTEVFLKTIARTIMPAGASSATPEQTAAFLVVANQYGLNPFNREIYAFSGKGGGIQAIVSVDGWAKLANEHPAFDGLQFEDTIDDRGNLTAITCRVFRKDRSHSIEVTEYLSECRRDTEPWRKWPGRMLRHKAMIQAFRIAFGFAGIIDPDEAERFEQVGAVSVTYDGVKRVDLDALPEASLTEPAQQQASLGQEPEKKRQRGRPRKVEASHTTTQTVTQEIVTSPVVETHQEPSVPYNPDADDPTDPPEYLQGIQQPQG